MKKKIVISVVILVIAAGAILGWAILRKNGNSAVKYRTEAIAKGDIEALVITTGTLNPVTVVEVGSQVSGRIDKIYVDFNSQVQKGQVIAELDKSILQTKVDQNQANYLSALASLEKSSVTLENLEKKYQRALSLFEEKLISYEEKEAAEASYLGAKTDLQAAEARVEQARSQLESSKVDLAYSIIRSPIDGVVISRNINVGQTVQASFQAPKLFEIANDLSKMQVECSVDEADIGKVEESQKVRFTVDAFPNETFNGVVRQVRYSPTMAQNVVTYTTIVDVDNPQMKLRPGMTATVSIVTGEAKGVLRVPNAALRFMPNLSAEEMKTLMEETRQKMMAKRQAEGESSGSEPAAPSAKRTGGEPDSGQRMMLFAQGTGGTGGRRPSTVWFLGEKGKLSIAFIRPGVTDNTYTEIVRGDLKEGQPVIVGYESSGGAGSASTGSGSRNPGGMMFMGPPRR
ncbi:MAG: efflux RND transporter periplasmic adaptor subunit [Candidatus Aminicenantes bacterium]|nr:efflux RND transporter periplasmic adaptor subunit [Candidatus Aminicenantes bacterium]